MSGLGRYRAWLAGLTFDWLERGTCAHPRQVLRYQPGRRLRNIVCARQRTCSFPGCRRPAARCDLDHTIPYDQGGLTCECNLAPLCRLCGIPHRRHYADGRVMRTGVLRGWVAAGGVLRVSA